jgi:hypothetical protein
LVGRVSFGEDLAKLIVHSFLAVVGAVRHSLPDILKQLLGLLGLIHRILWECGFLLSIRVHLFKVDASAEAI